MGSQFSSEWSSILRMARMILVVAEANVPALWTLERRLMALKGFGIETDRARVIINRWHKGDEEVLKSIQKDINRPVFACLPNDFRMASSAVNLGTPLQENHNNVLTGRYRQIAAQLAGLDVAPAAKKGSLGGFFSFPAKR
jgi:Flp pilus assembly CpaE family ATPase